MTRAGTTRREILFDHLRAVSDHGECRVAATRLAQELSWPRSLLQFHLDKLEHAGMLQRIDDRRGGRGMMHRYKLAVSHETANSGKGD